MIGDYVSGCAKVSLRPSIKGPDARCRECLTRQLRICVIRFVVVLVLFLCRLRCLFCVVRTVVAIVRGRNRTRSNSGIVIRLTAVGFISIEEIKFEAASHRFTILCCYHAFGVGLRRGKSRKISRAQRSGCGSRKSHSPDTAQRSQDRKVIRKSKSRHQSRGENRPAW
jgi:hypothetical protein